jgi:hypothetical protein
MADAELKDVVEAMPLRILCPAAEDDTSSSSNGDSSNDSDSDSFDSGDSARVLFRQGEQGKSFGNRQ